MFFKSIERNDTFYRIPDTLHSVLTPVCPQEECVGIVIDRKLRDQETHSFFVSKTRRYFTGKVGGGYETIKTLTPSFACIPNTWGFSKKITGSAFISASFFVEHVVQKKKQYEICHPNSFIKVDVAIADQFGRKIVRTHKKITDFFDSLSRSLSVSPIFGFTRIIYTIAIAIIFTGWVQSGAKNEESLRFYIMQLKWTAAGQLLRGALDIIFIIGPLINLGLDIRYQRLFSNAYQSPYLVPGKE